MYMCVCVAMGMQPGAMMPVCIHSMCARAHWGLPGMCVHTRYARVQPL